MLRRIAKGLIARLPFAVKYEIFYQSCRALGVTAYQANGSAGPIFGPLYDQIIMKEYLRTRSWSENIARKISEVFERSADGTFYDIGSNVGTVIVPVSRNKNIKCFGFEPDTENFSFLRANVAAYGAENTVLLNVAVAGKAGELRFTKNEWNSGDHRLSSDGDIVVRCIALDDMPLPTKPFVAKINTQGAEPAIFAGGEKTLATADLIIAEFWPWGMARMGQNPDAIIRFAERYFSRGLLVSHDKFGPIQPIADIVSELRRLISSHAEFDSVDLVLLN